MATLVIKSFPEELHVRLKKAAVENRRSVTQQTIRLLEEALNNEGVPHVAEPGGPTYWATRRVLPELEAALEGGAFSEGTESTESISEERDAR
jgi:hypothetical protein